ncbi:MAG: segregation/condensation protein A, partial [bacterium]|nr:segregation/condensation protein A [bacterium]
GTLTFRALVDDASGLNVVVARFLALLELFRSGAVAFEQAAALGELSVRWSGGDREFEIGREFDEEQPGPGEAEAEGGPAVVGNEEQEEE